MEAFVSDNGVGGFEHVIDLDGVVWEQLNVFDQPAWAFVNDDGTVEVNVGNFDFDELADEIEELIES